ncbi:hypothetical protein RZS08_62590, partial [Arthrospira platensis SPKY1]|nr:hypothetical protein [Arthrospira platensis SPKY1]
TIESSKIFWLVANFFGRRNAKLFPQRDTFVFILDYVSTLDIPSRTEYHFFFANFKGMRGE